MECRKVIGQYEKRFNQAKLEGNLKELLTELDITRDCCKTAILCNGSSDAMDEAYIALRFHPYYYESGFTDPTSNRKRKASEEAPRIRK